MRVDESRLTATYMEASNPGPMNTGSARFARRVRRYNDNVPS
jgi:hypothetical protein